MEGSLCCLYYLIHNKERLSMEVTFDVFQDLVRLLTEVAHYSDMGAYNVISAAMDKQSWAIEVIERTIMETQNIAV